MSRRGTRAGCDGLPPRAYTVLPSDTSRIEDVLLRSASAHAARCFRTSSRDQERGNTGHSAHSPAARAPRNTAFLLPPDASSRESRRRGGVIWALMLRPSGHRKSSARVIPQSSILFYRIQLYHKCFINQYYFVSQSLSTFCFTGISQERQKAFFIAI